MKTSWLLVTLAAVAAVTTASACKEDDDDGSSTTSTSTTTTTGTQGGGGAAATVTDDWSAEFTLACDGPKDDPTSDTGVTTMVERCIYDATNKQLSVNFENGKLDGAIDIDVLDFHGEGTYTTSKDESGTSVYVSTGSVSAGTWQSSPPGDFSAHTCTITVEKTNLTEVEIPQGAPTTGYLVLSLDCPVLGAATIGEITCDLTPAHFTFTVAKCEATM